MLKDITLGQYFPGTSRIHRLDPRTKLIMLVVYIVALFMAKSWVSYALMLAFLVFILVIQIRLHLRLAKNFGKGAGFGVGMAFLSAIFYPVLAFGKAQYIGPKPPQNNANRPNQPPYYQNPNNQNYYNQYPNQNQYQNNQYPNYQNPNYQNPNNQNNNQYPNG